MPRYRVFRSMANGRFVCAESGGNQPLVANRDNVGGSWEVFEEMTLIDGKPVSLDDDPVRPPQPPQPPQPPVNQLPWVAMRSVNFSDQAQCTTFATLCRTYALGSRAVTWETAQWATPAKVREMLDRGAELNEEPDRYYTERMCGRGADRDETGDWVASNGPYAGLVNYQGSLTKDL